MLRKNFSSRKQQRQREALLRQWKSIEAKFWKELQDTKAEDRHAAKRDIFEQRYGFGSLHLLTKIHNELGEVTWKS